MERLKKFSQFIEEKTAGLQNNKAKTTLMADYTAKTPNKPPANGKYPDQPANTGQVLPYGNHGRDMGLVMCEPDGATPLGQAKHPNMDPKKAAALGQPPAPRPSVHKGSRKALKEFVEITKGMSDTEFVNYLLNEGKKDRIPVQMVHDLYGEPFTPHPHEAIGYICSLMHNPKMISRLVREAKRHGHLENLVSELMDHPEFYDEAVKMMGDRDNGKKVTDKFARTMYDHYSKFRKDAGLGESRRRRGRLFMEKVADSLVDGNMPPEEAGIPMPDGQDGGGGNPMMNPGGMAEEPGVDPSQDDMGQQVGPDMNMEDPGMGDMGGQGGLTPAHGNMLQSMQGAFGNDGFNQAVQQFCQNGDC
jgi:hypothetical protein